MANPGNSFDLRSAVAVLAALAMLSGCAIPGHVGRSHVACELECRTGQSLGPEKSACEIAIPDLANLEDGISEGEAVAVGLWNNPSYQELLADLHITQADLIQAHQIANPQLTTMFPVSAKQWELTLMVPLDVLLLRPKRTAAAQLESQRVAERLVQDGLNVIRDVQAAYADVMKAEQEHALAHQGLELRDEIVRIAEARVKAGEDSELGASSIRLDAFFSEEQLVRTGRDVDLSREKLRFLMGVETTDVEIQLTPSEIAPDIVADVNDLVAEAMTSRPDLRALGIAVEAACERARLARYDYFNIWAALPDINAKGAKGFEAGPGLHFDLPIFNQNQGAIARAEAEAERLRRKYAARRDSVSLEVRQAYTQLERARSELAIWREQVVPEAESAVESARKALEEDGVSLLLVQQTVRQLLQAKQREIQAAAAVRRAVAELERSVGRRLLPEPRPFSGFEAFEAPQPDDVDEAIEPPEPDDIVEEVEARQSVDVVEEFDSLEELTP